MLELYNRTGGHLTCPHPLQKKKKKGWSDVLSEKAPGKLSEKNEVKNPET